MSDSKTYRRPNEEWVCGWKRRGFECPSGPSRSGTCQKKGLCQPALIDGHYKCTKNDGACGQGPRPDGQCAHPFPPCSPKRSIKAKRRLLAIGGVALAISALMILFGRLSTENVFFTPGELSGKHSSFSNDCAACHANAHKSRGVMAWVFGEDHRVNAQSKCLDCHSMGENAFSPHSLAQKELDQLSVKLAGGVNPHSGEQKQCTACHKEHLGSDHQLANLTSQQCQSCHLQKFESFAKGHPDFSDYPFGKRVHLMFDHTAHFSQHFEKKEAGKNISCQTCHTPSATGEGMVLAGYKAACSNCHDDQIRGDGATTKGLALFQLPGIDMETLRGKNYKVGEWPEYAEGEMSPFTRLMLSTDSEIAEVLDSLNEDDIDLEDLGDEEVETLDKVKKLVWGIKKFLLKATEGGSETMNEVISEHFGEEIDPSTKSGLMASMPVDVVRAAVKGWFSNLPKEVERFDGGQWIASKVGPEPEEIEDEDLMEMGGWYRDNSTFSIRYRPTGHSDAFMKSWLTLASKNRGSSTKMEAIFESLSDRSETPGKCAKCHSIEKVSDESMKIYWKMQADSGGRQGFVRFSHNAHLNLIKENGCFTCHDMNEQADFAKIYDSHDPTVFESNFKSINKNKCAACHADQQVSDSCMTCHNYHIGDFFTSKSRMERVKTNLHGNNPGSEKEATEDQEESETE